MSQTTQTSGATLVAAPQTSSNVLPPTGKDALDKAVGGFSKALSHMADAIGSAGSEATEANNMVYAQEDDIKGLKAELQKLRQVVLGQEETIASNNRRLDEAEKTIASNNRRLDEAEKTSASNKRRLDEYDAASEDEEAEEEAKAARQKFRDEVADEVERREAAKRRAAAEKAAQSNKRRRVGSSWF